MHLSYIWGRGGGGGGWAMSLFCPTCWSEIICNDFELIEIFDMRENAMKTREKHTYRNFVLNFLVSINNTFFMYFVVFLIKADFFLYVICLLCFLAFCVSLCPFVCRQICRCFIDGLFMF